MNKIIYDFEVFKKDWMVVFFEYETKKEVSIINSKEELESYYNKHNNDIWIGYNNTYYDQYIFKGILLGMNPKEINDFIILQKENPKMSIPKNDIKMFNFDLSNKFRGLKELEGFMGSKIKESDISFDLDRKLTKDEIKEVLDYCKHDVNETVKVYENLKDELESHILMIDTFNLPMEKFENTKAQLSAFILGAERTKYDRNDDFNLNFPDTLILNKHFDVLEWYKDVKNMNYKKKFFKEVSGVPHIFGWGGIHGALPSYIDVEGGCYIMSDISSMYPALMIEYDYLSRNVKNKEKYREIRDRRLELKKIKDPKQAPLKIVLNSTYGASKDKYNDLFDPLMANNVCIAGQLLLLDLIEKVEPYCKLIQSNTDGILVKIENEEDKNKYLEECDKWCKRSRLDLEHDEYAKVIQKDVNNYIIVDKNGNYKSKGAYVKKLSKIDYDLPIVNEAVVQYFLNKTPIEETILGCDEFIKFQKIVKLTSKYRTAFHNGQFLKERVFRVFASNDKNDDTIYKIKGKDKYEKISNTPLNCFIYNEDIKNERCPDKLDKFYYIDLAKDRIDKFENAEFKFKIDSGIKYVGNDCLEWLEENIKKYDDFIEFFYILIENSNKRERDVLTKIGKLNKFGTIKKCLTFMEYHDKLKKKTYNKEKTDSELLDYIKPFAEETDKMYKNLDKESILNVIWDNIPNDEIDIKEQMQYELQYLGYISSEIPKNISICSCEMVSTKHRSVNCKSFRNNQTKWFKIKKGVSLPSKGDCIIIQKMSTKKGYKGRKDFVIEKYEKIS